MIEHYEVKKIELSNVKLDKANPNKMSDKQLESLRYALKKFGGLQPIIIDDKFNLIDGEHRWRAYHLEGETEIPAIIVPNVTEAQKRLIRQTMNKLHGQHQEDLDIEEYKALLGEGMLGELGKLLAKEEEDFRNLLAKVQATHDADPTEDKLDAYLYGSIRQVVLYFQPEQYDKVIDQFQEIMREKGLADNTAVVLSLLEEYNASVEPEEKTD